MSDSMFHHFIILMQYVNVMLLFWKICFHLVYLFTCLSLVYIALLCNTCVFVCHLWGRIVVTSQSSRWKCTVGALNWLLYFSIASESWRNLRHDVDVSSHTCITHVTTSCNLPRLGRQGTSQWHLIVDPGTGKSASDAADAYQQNWSSGFLICVPFLISYCPHWTISLWTAKYNISLCLKPMQSHKLLDC